MRPLRSWIIYYTLVMDKKIDSDAYYYQTQFPQDDSIDKIRVLLTRSLKASSHAREKPYQALAKLFLDSNQHSKSIMHLRKASIIDPETWDAWQDLVKTLFLVGKDKQAFFYLKKALIIHPNVYNLHLILIDTLSKQNKLEELDCFYRGIAELLPSKRLVGQLYFVAAETLLSSNKISQALSHYQKAVEMNPERHSYAFKYGLALYHGGQILEAIEQFEHAYRIDQNDKIAVNNIAFLNYSLGKVSNAIARFWYILDNNLEIHTTYSNLIVVLHHIKASEEEITPVRNMFQPFITSHGFVLRKLYNEELRLTELKLQSEIDKETREFNTQKLQSLNYILSLLG